MRGYLWVINESGIVAKIRFDSSTREVKPVELKKKDYESLGSLMLRNHELLRSLGVSNTKLDKLVDIAMDNGALGAKLTGAGGGGSVIALTDDTDRLLNALKGYHAFVADIDNDGVRLE